MTKSNAKFTFESLVRRVNLSTATGLSLHTSYVCRVSLTSPLF